MRLEEPPESSQSLRCGEVDGRLPEPAVVPTRRPFLAFSEVELCENGVVMIMRASRGGFVLSRRFHDVSRRLVQQDVEEQKRREGFDQKLAKLKQMAPTQC